MRIFFRQQHLAYSAKIGKWIWNPLHNFKLNVVNSIDWCFCTVASFWTGAQNLVKSAPRCCMRRLEAKATLIWNMKKKNFQLFKTNQHHHTVHSSCWQFKYGSSKTRNDEKKFLIAFTFKFYCGTKKSKLNLPFTNATDVNPIKLTML